MNTLLVWSPKDTSSTQPATMQAVAIRMLGVTCNDHMCVEGSSELTVCAACQSMRCRHAPGCAGLQQRAAACSSVQQQQQRAIAYIRMQQRGWEAASPSL